MPTKSSPIMATLLVQEGELHVGVSKETKKLFSFQKHSLQENTILCSCEIKSHRGKSEHYFCLH